MGQIARMSVWLGIVSMAGLAVGCGSSVDPNTDVLKIGAYSVVREVLHDGVLPAFAAEWKSRTGREPRIRGVV